VTRFKIDASSSATGRAGYGDETVERIRHDAFNALHFLLRELLELSFAPVPRKRAVVLPDEHHQVFGDPVRHFDRFHDAFNGLIVAAQIVDLARQVFVHGALHAGIEKLRGLLGSAVPNRRQH
jgi:hypothetical protein